MREADAAGPVVLRLRGAGRRGVEGREGEVDQTGGYFVKAPALRGVCLRERRGDDSATYIMPLGGLVYKERIASSTHFGIGTLPVSQRERMIQRADV